MHLHLELLLFNNIRMYGYQPPYKNDTINMTAAIPYPPDSFYISTFNLPKSLVLAILMNFKKN